MEGQGLIFFPFLAKDGLLLRFVSCFPVSKIHPLMLRNMLKHGVSRLRGSMLINKNQESQCVMMNLRHVVYSPFEAYCLMRKPKPLVVKPDPQTPCLMLNQNHRDQPMRCDRVVYVAPYHNQE